MKQSDLLEKSIYSITFLFRKIQSAFLMTFTFSLIQVFMLLPLGFNTLFAQATTTQSNPIRFVWLPIFIETSEFREGELDIYFTHLAGKKLKNHGQEIFNWVDVGIYNPNYRDFLRHLEEDLPLAAREIMTAHGTDIAYIMRFNITKEPKGKWDDKITIEYIDSKFYHRRGDRIIDISQFISPDLFLKVTKIIRANNEEDMEGIIDEYATIILSTTDEIRRALIHQRL